AGGVINANASGRLLDINTGSNTISNAGLLEATGGGILEIDSKVQNSGTIRANAGSQIYIAGDLAGTSVLQATGSGASITLAGRPVTGSLQAGTGSVVQAQYATFDGTGSAFTTNAAVTVLSGYGLTLAGTIHDSGSFTLGSGSLLLVSGTAGLS